MKKTKKKSTISNPSPASAKTKNNLSLRY